MGDPVTKIDPIALGRTLTDTYQRYLGSLIAPNDPAIDNALRGAISEMAASDQGLAKGPYLELTPAYEQSKTARELLDAGLLDGAFSQLESESFSLDRPWYTHQVRALERVSQGKNLIVATGTGSGKTESFLLPILNQLLAERARGNTRPGVRALLLYPMNALANDQLKRLRQVLASVPEITFGRYTGETEKKRAHAEAKFKAQHPGQDILPNELLSREEMRAEAPHLLLTNYAMLEYLLLRPEDSELFGDPEDSTWQFIVVDEAHVYDGANGAEIGYLLRRLRERVAPGRSLQCIATSATVGTDLERAAQFGSDLFGAPFDAAGDIVTASHRQLFRAPAWGRLTPDAIERSESLADLIQHARSLGAPAHLSEFEALTGELTVRDLHDLGRQQPRSIRGVLAQLPVDGLTESQLIKLIDFATHAHDVDGTPALAAKYHLFARATEGAFTCLSPSGPHLSLTRRERCDCGWCVFEISACRRCGGVHLVGSEQKISGQRIFSPKSGNTESTVWVSLTLAAAEDIDEDDATLDEASVTDDARQVGLCPRCGTLATKPGSACVADGCGTTTLAVSRKVTPTLRKCMQCGGVGPRIIRRFESGNDASVGVLTTALYQELPAAQDDSVFLPGAGRKALVFSDSRQQAAFFAPYLEDSYERLIQRRLVYLGIERVLKDEDTAQASDIARSARIMASNAGYFLETTSNSARYAATSTWVQAEMMSLDERQSLEGVGMITWRMRRPRNLQMPQPLLDLGLSPDECFELFQALVRTLRVQGAVGGLEDVNLQDDIFQPRLGPIYVRSTGSDTRRKVISWLPSSAGGVQRKNTRSHYLGRVLDALGADADVNEVLDGIWRALTATPGSFTGWFVDAAAPGLGAVKQLDPDAIEATLRTPDTPAWRCSTCGMVSHVNVRDVCLRFRCAGSLEPWTARAGGHYEHLYRTLEVIPLSASEHTAQWTSQEAARIQQEFIDGKLNVLSCSTTFELGVDVGELQSVVLRNVPPTVSNYIQRAGRVGRRSGSAALVLTYAQRRSHDLTVFADPAKQIAGAVRTPVVPTRNPRLAQRHFFSVALAAFWRAHAAAGGKRLAHTESFFLPTESGTSIAEQVGPWLLKHRDELQESIDRIATDTGLAKEDCSWKSWSSALIERLAEVQAAYVEESNAYADLMNQAFENKQGARGDYYKRVLTTINRQTLISFLANRNLIPKYGFPVDTVEMQIPGGVNSGKLDLSRDLSQAIFEYAPGTQLVAAGKVWTSSGVARQRDRENPPVYYRICKNCDAYSESAEDDRGPCETCGEMPTGTPQKYMEPRFGFIASSKTEATGEVAPRASWRGHNRIAKDGHVVYSGSLPVTGGDVLFEVLERATMVRINAGSADIGFKICNYCGFSVSGYAEWPSSHDDLLRSRPCNGHASTFSLAHKYETDVLRIRFPRQWGGEDTAKTAQSVLYAVLHGATDALQIVDTNIDGSISSYHTSAPTIDIVDTVPGGAGYARIIAQALPVVLRRALQLADECECGQETSCYMCLRTFRNQRVHDDLSRGAAADFLHGVLGSRALGDPASSPALTLSNE